jgi:hypothetical protein
MSYLPKTLPWKYEGNRFAIVLSPRGEIGAAELRTWEQVATRWAELTGDKFRPAGLYLVRTTWPHAVDASVSFGTGVVIYSVSEIMAHLPAST